MQKTKPLRYAVGMFGTSIPINMFKTFAAIYYVDKLGLSTASFSLVLLIYTFVDAFSESDWESAKKLPNLSHLVETGASTRSLKSVFPTHTYTIHTSIVTGVYPDKHGILHNHPLQPFVPILSDKLRSTGYKGAIALEVDCKFSQNGEKQTPREFLTRAYTIAQNLA